MTFLARLLIGWHCVRIGPRLACSGLLVLGAIPVMCIVLAQSYETSLLFRLAIWLGVDYKQPGGAALIRPV